MKVTGTGGVGQAGGARGTQRSADGSFRLPSMGETAGPAQSSNVSTAHAVMGVEALLTLQDVGGPLERKRRAVGRAGRILDLLDGVKLALLEGRISGDALIRLQGAVREQRAGTDDPRLEALLDEIETRAAVEIAKLEQARAA
ncbi:flagellar assembly protein FliX [Phenylobacterium sp.]|uniref:flagellar assembly regulator FliX n=1 Tax=Phenylobacterium sp. TaxID=1871053 RepID=UPI002DE8B631|nr:flagellar assembly protein FliX [Phenylobacterium sp.]